MKEIYHPFRFSRSGLKGLKPSPTLSINELVHEMRAAGRDVYHLGFGESRFPVHPLIAQALQDATLPGATFGDDPKALALRLSTSYLDMETDEQAQNIAASFNDVADPDSFIVNHHPRLREVVTRLADFMSELEE